MRNTNRHFADLFRLYHKKIFNLAYRMTGNIDDARDITQETFLHALISFDKFKGKSTVYTWLYRIAKNNCLRSLEKKKKTTFLSLSEMTEQVSSPVSSSITEAEKSNYISQVKDGCLSGLIRCLPLQQRLAFIFSVLLGMNTEKVAEIIGKSENATRILIHRSKQNIEEYLCRHCSFYHIQNSCRCENLINFSLKQGWISSENEIKMNHETELEIGRIKNILTLYQSVEEIIPGKKLTEEIRQMIEQKNFLIFKDKKLK